MTWQETMVREKVLALARDGQLPCAAALRLATELGVTPQAVGQAADAAGVKIIACQLGCFGGAKEKKRHGVL